MQRRTLLKGVGTAAAATAGLAGSAAARPALGVELDRPLAVSDVSGQVALADLLDESELRRLDGDVDPTDVTLVVSETADTIDPADDCCKTYKKCFDEDNETNCTCACCVCPS